MSGQWCSNPNHGRCYLMSGGRLKHVIPECSCINLGFGVTDADGCEVHGQRADALTRSEEK